MRIPRLLSTVVLALIGLTLVASAQEPLHRGQKSTKRGSGSVQSLATFTRTITFADHQWLVKDGFSGPGPNYFSDSSKNVWVDQRGRLHLRIRRQRRRWYTAEVVLAETLGYGTYRFVVDSPVADLDLNAVLGLFTWCTNPPAANCEIDIEFSRWGDELNQNGSYVVQPYYQSGHVYPFELPPDSPTTHSFTWRPDSVFFQSLRGLYDPSGQNDEIQSWGFVQSVPPSTGANARMNLWLRGGLRPARKKTKSIEVVVSSFAFEPLP